MSNLADAVIQRHKDLNNPTSAPDGFHTDDMGYWVEDEPSPLYLPPLWAVILQTPSTREDAARDFRTGGLAECQRERWTSGMDF